MAVRSLAQSSLVEPFSNSSMLAGYESNYFHHLETVRLSSSAATVEFSNLARYSDFQHLQIRMAAQVTGTASTVAGMTIVLNGDGGANYAYHVMQGQGSSVASVAGASQTSITIQNVFPRASETNKFGAAVIDFADAYSTSKNTTERALHGSLASGEVSIGLSSGLWMNTNALSSIELSGATDLSTGSRFSLYGLKARS